jgi:hypothetical protein
MTDEEYRELDIRERFVHIDQMLADHQRKRQEIKFAPWQLTLTGMAAGAALFAAGGAFFSPNSLRKQS